MCGRKCSEHYKPPEYNVPIVEHGDGSSMMWGHILSAGTGKVVRADGKMNMDDPGIKPVVGCGWNLSTSRKTTENIQPEPQFRTLDRRMFMS